MCFFMFLSKSKSNPTPSALFRPTNLPTSILLNVQWCDSSSAIIMLHSFCQEPSQECSAKGLRTLSSVNLCASMIETFITASLFMGEHCVDDWNDWTSPTRTAWWPGVSTAVVTRWDNQQPPFESNRKDVLSRFEICFKIWCFAWGLGDQEPGWLHEVHMRAVSSVAFFTTLTKLNKTIFL